MVRGFFTAYGVLWFIITLAIAVDIISCQRNRRHNAALCCWTV